MRQTAASEKRRAAVAARERLLTNLIRTRRTGLDPGTLSQAYAVPIDRVRDLIARNGGSIG